jgi:hypothetical protein
MMFYSMGESVVRKAAGKREQERTIAIDDGGVHTGQHLGEVRLEIANACMRLAMMWIFCQKCQWYHYVYADVVKLYKGID